MWLLVSVTLEAFLTVRFACAKDLSHKPSNQRTLVRCCRCVVNRFVNVYLPQGLFCLVVNTSHLLTVAECDKCSF